MAIGESKKEVRTTWIGFTVIFGVIASLLLYKERGSYPYWYGISAFFAFFATVAPMALLPLYRLWVKFALFLAWFNTKLLLSLTFYLVVTPIGFLMRLCGKDPMERKIDKNAESYWKKREPQTDPSRHYKQF